MRPLRPPECIQTDRENEKDMSDVGTSQPWQLPRRTAGHGSKADAGAQPLAGCQSLIAELEQEIDANGMRGRESTGFNGTNVWLLINSRCPCHSAGAP
jgi:hypothetical protein